MTAEDVDTLGKACGWAAREQLGVRDRDATSPLRLSRVGMPNRRLWYEAKNPADIEEEEDWRLRAAFGGITEELLLWLCVKAGHLVERRQEEVDLGGVKGHIDCIIDGVLVDVKSASSYGFRKFKYGDIYKDDPYGYIAQLSTYNQALGFQNQSAYWLVMDKSLGDLLLVELTEVEQINGLERIEEAKRIIAMKGTGPERCYPLEPVGKSGNKALGKMCSWCPHKHDCYSKANDGKGLRTFQYANGPLDLAVITKEPRVPEICCD